MLCSRLPHACQVPGPSYILRPVQASPHRIARQTEADRGERKFHVVVFVENANCGQRTQQSIKRSWMRIAGSCQNVSGLRAILQIICDSQQRRDMQRLRDLKSIDQSQSTQPRDQNYSSLTPNCGAGTAYDVGKVPGSDNFPTTGRSFCLDVGRFDERPPFLDLRFLEHTECLRALLIQCGNLLT